MKLLPVVRGLLMVGTATALTAGFAPAAPSQTPVQTNGIWRATWHDADRNRDVPVKIYYPTGIGPFPVIIFSHGLGGTAEGYSYLGDYWSKHGYVSVHLQHIGTDDSVWKNRGGLAAIKTAVATAMTPANARARAGDVSFAIDQLEALNKTATWPLQGKLDLAKIGMAGHSFGANTTLLVSGLGLPGFSVKDPRIKCAVALSSPPPGTKNYDTLFAGIKIPMFHMTGTADVSPVDNRNVTGPLDRRIPYDHITGADAYLTTFAGGDHMVFSGQRRGPAVSSDDRNHELILESTTAFWDAYLKGDGKAKSWLQNDFKGELGANGIFEDKAEK